MKDENELSQPDEQVSIKLFNEKQMQAAAFFGGPLPVGILLFKNFKRLGKDNAAFVALALSLILLTLILFLSISGESIINDLPRLAMPAFYSILTFFIYRNFLYKQVSEAMSMGAKKASNWVVVGYTILGLFITLSIAIGLVFFEPEFDGPFEKYGNNRLFHDGTISEEILRKTADQLYAQQYFDHAGFDASIKQDENTYAITLLYNSDVWEDEEFISYMKGERLLFQSFIDKEVVLVLRDYDINGNYIFRQIRE